MRDGNDIDGIRLLGERRPLEAGGLALRRRIDDALERWLRELDVLPHPCGAVTRYGLGHFAASCYGDAADEARLALAARYFAALFILDDHYCDDERLGSVAVLLGERLTLVLALVDPVFLSPAHEAAFGAVVAADPVLRVWRAFMDELAALATAAQLGRVRHEIVNMLLSMAGEASWRMAGKIPPGWEYAVNRQFNGALPCTALIDVVAGYEVPASCYYDPAIRRCSVLAGNAIMIGNDFFSAAKESRTRSGAYNLARIMAGKGVVTPEEARRINAALFERTVAEFHAARAGLPFQLADEARRYLDGLELWIGGAVDWFNGTARYPQDG